VLHRCGFLDDYDKKERCTVVAFTDLCDCRAFHDGHCVKMESGISREKNISRVRIGDRVLKMKIN